MPKRIIICTDGTWNKPDQMDHGVLAPSNVVKMNLSIVPNDPTGMPQVVFYDQGVGTEWGLDRITGGAFGTGLSKNIQDSYRFLVANYDKDDEIFFFGFSRGAYTVRSLVGLIRNCGILEKAKAARIPEAFALYKNKEILPDDNPSITFREEHSREVRIKFVGVWDTVGALGIPVWGLRWLTKEKHNFHDVRLSNIVDYAYQALAIDERRGPFKPSLWENKETSVQNPVEQTWFAGVHSNIGGGYSDSGLSDLAFLWMQEKAKNAGLAFDQNYITSNIKGNYLGKLRNSKSWYYIFFKDFIRPIKANAKALEIVHESASKRWEQNNLRYKPKNWPLNI